MNIEMLAESVEKVESVILNIIYLKPEERIMTPSYTNMSDLKDALNNLFSDDCTCLSVTYTHNTDKPFFGVRINPLISSNDALRIIISDDRVKLVKYELELDSKLFDIGLSEDEITAIIVNDISSLMGSYEIFDSLRALIDLSLVSEDDIINIRDSVNYAQLIIYALKDTLYKLSSFVFKEEPDDLLVNPTIQATNLGEPLISAREKVFSSLAGLGESVRTPKVIILKWMFQMYKSLKTNSRIVRDTVMDSIAFTGSKLEIKELNRVIEALNKIDNSIMVESYSNKDIFHFLKENHLDSVLEASLFKNLKQSGLRAIENDFYEFALRVKNCNTEEDAIYILRGINSRLGLLEDYLVNEDMPDNQREHWTRVSNQYRELRVALSKKNIWKRKSYGLFFDYNQLDNTEEDE